MAVAVFGSRHNRKTFNAKTKSRTQLDRPHMINFFRSVTTALTVLALLASTTLHANNIQVANAALAGNNSISAFAFVQFDVSWENSWKGNGINNWDAAWVFAKYRTAGGAWQHVQFNNTGHTAPAGSQIDLGLLTPGTAFNANTNPVIGTYLLRSAEGTGTFSATGVQLRWNYGLQGLNYADIAEVRVFAIEMVYVPQGAFFVGTGGTEDGSFTEGSWVSGATIPRQITSEGAITIGTGAGNLWGTSNTGNDNTIGPAGSLASSYPKGFAAFYCMKYEVTQQGYVDFLNTLTYTQQVTRTATVPASVAGTGALSSTNLNRNGIDIQTPGVASTTPAVYACNLDGDAVYGEAVDGKDIACNWISWGDLTAYLDWSGHRPMTELEFEKACRGTLAPGANEYPWGTTGVAVGAYALANAGAINEGIATNYSPTLGNASYSTTDGAINGPLRVGILAANGSNTGRNTSGAGYYGIMEMGGNLWERPVTIGNANGRAFTGSHGNGTLLTTGDPDVATWPTPITASGAGFRGGSWIDAGLEMRVSSRSAASTATVQRIEYVGGRGIRSAP